MEGRQVVGSNVWCGRVGMQGMQGRQGTILGGRGGDAEQVHQLPDGQ